MVSPPADPVVIVGAGAAGLAAASRLRACRVPVVLLEAGPRPGGRARTVSPAILGGASFDEGASWLHQVDRNPLADLARASGLPLAVAHREERRLRIGSRAATAAETAAYDAADSAWRDRAAARAVDATVPDVPLSAIGDAAEPGDPWLPNIELWEGAIIAAADADALSLHDWHRNGLDGDDLEPEHGVGRLLLDLLGPTAGSVSLDTAVRRIDATRADRLVVSTDSGGIHASACIVTVSTGVLRAERIAFAPALPSEILSALDGLPMGLLSKIALPLRAGAAAPAGRAELVERRLPIRGAPGLLLHTPSAAAPFTTAYGGGRFAWSLAPDPGAAFAALRDHVAAACGTAAAAVLADRGHLSTWGTDPRFLGAYAYARPGHAGARAVLGRPFADGRIVLAGEACRTDGLAGTVGGAIADGDRAAAHVLHRLGA